MPTQELVHPMIQTDFYKVNHRRQYPENTQLVFSNFTARSPKHCGIEGVEGVVFFGLQRFILDHLIDEWDQSFFSVPREDAVMHYKRRIETSLGPDVIEFDHLGDLHDLGYLPIRIRALPEGSVVPFKVPMLTVENTMPEFFWLTNYLETVLSCELWKPCTTATIAREYRKILEHFGEMTGANKDLIPISVHDFSMRGMSGRHDAANAGMGHLTSFKGSDCIPAINSAELYYGIDAEEELIGTSIPASEHSVMCAGGKEDEFSTYKRFITELYPHGLVGIVSDTWDLWHVLREIAPALKDEIMAREGKVVFRPDSGDPADILCGTLRPEDVYEMDDGSIYTTEKEWMSSLVEPELAEKAIKSGEHGEPGDDKVWMYIKDCDGHYALVTAEVFWNRHDKQFYYFDGLENFEVEEAFISDEQRGAVEILYEEFGGSINEKGYIDLDPHVGLIYGDSITIDKCQEICERLEEKGFSTGNVVFGVGSYTYQMITRDTFGMAMKATYCEIDGEPREIFKDPVTDDGIKKSAKGLLMVVRDGDRTLKLFDQVSWDDVNSPNNELQTVFEDGKVVRKWTFSQIRDRIEASL